MALKKITQLNLSAFKKPEIPANRGFAWRASWYLVNTIFFQSSIISLLPSYMKSFILRAFGAKIGREVVIKPRISVKYPWLLEIGDHVWLGEQVWIDNPGPVRIGSNCCISQGSYLCTGNHDWSDPAFAFFSRPIILGNGVWVTAFSVLPPGTEIPAGHVWKGRG